ncbi:hypothetical protein D3C84_351180 [compost metagenome]
MALLQIGAVGLGTIGPGIVEHQSRARAHRGVEHRGRRHLFGRLPGVQSDPYIASFDRSRRRQLQFGAADDHQHAIVGTGLNHQVIHQGFDQSFEQNLLRQRTRRFDPHFKIETDLGHRPDRLERWLRTQKRVQGFQLTCLAFGAPQVVAIARDTQVVAGTRHQPVG